MVLVNGREAQGVDIADRGLHYGDGVFETIAVMDAQPIALARHLARLAQGCHRLDIESPDCAVLAAEIWRVLEGVEQAVIKLIVTRGTGASGYRPVLGPPTRIVLRGPPRHYPARFTTIGIDARVCRLRLAPNPRLAGIKHLNRLEQVMARAEWGMEFQEGVLLDHDGWVIEGTMSNVFFLRDGILCTPALIRAGVAGILRERIFDYAQVNGLNVVVGQFTLGDLQAAEAIFFCNSLIGIWPVRRLEAISYRIPSLVRQLQHALAHRDI